MAEKGGNNLYGFVSNSTTQYVDKYGFQQQSADSIGADRATLSSGVNPLDMLRVLYSIPFDIASGDIFRQEIEDNYNDTQCEFLITITGIFTDKDGNNDFNRFIRGLPPYNNIPNATLVYNPTRFIILDLIQILGNEIGTIDTVARRAAEKITNAALKARDNNCSNCYTIYVVAHSQGTMVFKEALYLLSEELKNRIAFVGLGGQVAIDGSSVLISARNIAAKEDLVPWANMLPTRAIDGFGGSIEIFESGKNPKSAHDSVGYIEYLRNNP